MLRGSLRHRVSIYAPETYDIGNEVETWKLVGSPYASVKMKEIKEEGSNDLKVTELIEFTVPYSSQLEANQQDVIVVFRGDEYDVKSVYNVAFRDRELRITAKRYDSIKRVV